MSAKPEMPDKLDKFFDKRIVMRHIKRGRLSRKDYEEHLATLSDATVKAVPMFTEGTQLGGAGRRR